MRSSRSYFHRAFTLIELLVVVAIIAVLIGILVPTMSMVHRSAMKTATVGQLNAIHAGLEQYYLDFNMYPPSSPLIPGTNTPAYNAIPAQHGASMLAEALLGYLPGTADGAGISASDPNDFGFRTSKVGAGMAGLGIGQLGQIRGPYAPFDPKDFNSNPVTAANPTATPTFIDVWGHDILYYRSTRTGTPDNTFATVTSIFGTSPTNSAAAATFYFDSNDCAASKATGSSGPSTADPLAVMVSKPSQIKPFWPLISATGNTASSGTGVITGVTGEANYLLISAGPDETYFSSDDVVVSK